LRRSSRTSRPDARRDDLVIVLGPARVVDSVTVSATRIEQALVMCRRA
jgi:hypothetical protein